MLKITVPAIEAFDDESQTFLTIPGVNLELEHSLLSLSQWESKWKRPFLSDGPKTPDEINDYIRCMSLNELPPGIEMTFTDDVYTKVNGYIGDPMTATTITERQNSKTNREVITAEIVYYWMVALNIPFECETWHFHRLLTLVRVCNIKNSPPKKMSRRESLAQQRDINAARRQAQGTSG